MKTFIAICVILALFILPNHVHADALRGKLEPLDLEDDDTPEGDPGERELQLCSAPRCSWDSACIGRGQWWTGASMMCLCDPNGGGEFITCMQNTQGGPGPTPRQGQHTCNFDSCWSDDECSTVPDPNGRVCDRCVQNTCMPQGYCRNSSHCPRGSDCDGGLCRPPLPPVMRRRCRNVSQCPRGSQCIRGFCRRRPGGGTLGNGRLGDYCFSIRDCQTGLRCRDNRCRRGMYFGLQ